VFCANNVIILFSCKTRILILLET